MNLLFFPLDVFISIAGIFLIFSLSAVDGFLSTSMTRIVQVGQSFLRFSISVFMSWHTSQFSLFHTVIEGLVIGCVIRVCCLKTFRELGLIWEVFVH